MAQKLIRYVAQSTGLSRREVMRRLQQGRIQVNGRVQTASTVQVEQGQDRVVMDGSLVPHLPPLHLMMYKPRATICTRDDDRGRGTVYELLRPTHRRAASVGRLDFHTTGLLLFTTEGNLAQRLTRPQRAIQRVYRVKLKGDVSEDKLDRWLDGVRVQGRIMTALRVKMISSTAGHATVNVTLTSGANRQIHRMAQAVGLFTVKIHRMHFAGLSLGDLRPGGYRDLTAQEVQKLYRLTGLEAGPGRGRRSPPPR